MKKFVGYENTICNLPNNKKVKVPTNSQIIPVIRLLPVNLKIASRSHQRTGKMKKRSGLVTNFSAVTWFLCA